MALERASYPKLQQTLSALRKDSQLTLTELVKTTKMKRPTLRSYLRGVRCPTPENIQILARALSPTPRSVKKVVRRILDACDENPRPFLEALAVGDTQLKVRSAGFLFPPLVDGHPETDRLNEGLKQFYERSFHHLIGKPAKDLASKPDLGARYQDLRSGKYDLLLNYLCSPQRLLEFEFLLTPIRVSLNACCIANQENIEDIKRQLIGEATESSSPIEIICVEWSVAAWHAKHVSKSSGHLVEIERLSIAKLADELRKRLRKSTTTAVVLGTEPTILGVVAKLKGKARLVFPVSGSPNIQFFEARRELPEYGLGIAWQRGHNTPLKDFMNVALDRYLTDSATPIARLYADLFQPLRYLTYKTLRDARHAPVESSPKLSPIEKGDHISLDLLRSSRSYSRHVLRLDRSGITQFEHAGSPWKNILLEARALVCSRESEKRSHIRSEVEDRIEQLGITSGAVLESTWALGLAQQLESDFDVDFSRLPETLKLPKKPRIPEEVVSLVQAALFCEETISPPIILFPHHQLTPYAKSQLRTLDAQQSRTIAHVTSTREGYSNVQRILAQRGHLIVGSAFLRRDSTGKIFLQELIVKEDHRGHHIGLRLVWEAFRWLIDNSAKSGKVGHLSEIFVRTERMTKGVRAWFERLGFDKRDARGDSFLSYRFARFAGSRKSQELATHGSNGKN